MITLGAKYGGPDVYHTAFETAWLKAAKEIKAANGGNANSWIGNVLGINVVFYIAGSIQNNSDIPKVEAKRFSRKQKLLLINVPVPNAIIRDYESSIHFIAESLQEACNIASEILRKKTVEPFDLERALSIVRQIV